MQADQLTPQLKSLLNFLSEQLQIYKQLLELTLRERATLMASKLETFNEIAAKKNDLIDILSEIEQQRIALMKEIAKKFRLDADHFSLVRLVSLVDETTGKKLYSLRTDLRSVIATLQKENETNSSLMTHCIKLMDHSLGMLKSVLCYEPTYVSTGHCATMEGGGVLFQSKV